MLNFKESLNRLSLSAGTIAGLCGFFSFVFRIPFLLFRYDLHFGGDSGTAYLMGLHILNGDRPLYHYGQDYNVALEAYASAILFKIFHPSIPLAGSFCLFEWSAAVSLGVYLLIRGTDKFHGVMGGVVAVIGVPYTLHYIVAPIVGHPLGVILGMLILWQTFFLITSGPTLARLFLWGFTAGAGFFMQKLCAPHIAASLLAFIFLKTSAWNPLQLEKPLQKTAVALTGALLGFFPEIWYRLHHNVSNNLIGFADPLSMVKNFYDVFRSVPAYFDAQPISREAEAVYFFLQHRHISPGGPLDIFFIIMGFTVVFFAWKSLKRSYVEKNAPLFLLASLIFANMAMVVPSLQAGGDFWNVRRYLYPAAIPLSLFAGFGWACLIENHSKKIQWAALAVGFLFIGRVLFHEYTLLRSPDELREIRWVIQGMKEEGLNRGLAHWGHAYIIDALTDEQIIVAGRDFNDRFPEYVPLVSQADRIALIEMKTDPLEKKISFAGNDYQMDGSPQDDEVFRWIPYKKINLKSGNS